MAGEELLQRGYIINGKLIGASFGVFKQLDLGATSLKELVSSGLDTTICQTISYPFKAYKAPKKPESCKPDRLVLDTRKGSAIPIACIEWKPPNNFDTDKKILSACEQALFAASALGISLAIATDGNTFKYINVVETLNSAKLVFFEDHRNLNPSVIEDILTETNVTKNPTQLAQTVWQLIWQATKEEPKACLLTFVELFMLKFLSDNLSSKDLPRSKSFYELVDKEKHLFESTHGQTPIEYYVTTIRPYIKSLFPDNTVASDEELANIFGMGTVVSKTSVINGFAFLKSSTESVNSFNRTFLEILNCFKKFGSLTNIDPEFKLRLYETFLKNTPKQQALGQFFTPRNVVREMIRMADLRSLPDDSVLLDPAAGVGGFILEPYLMEDSIRGNLDIKAGKPVTRIKTIGVDMDVNTHILAKANFLIHMAELLKKPNTTLPALNKAMANTFLLMNSNETLGSLENPPRNIADAILANPPYVTQGSAVYRKELAAIIGGRNGVNLQDYYNGWGLGVEALFLRYISGALKPGAFAFVIVPLGMLNRTEKRPKEKLLREVNLIASINLPRNTFFNTSQATCILVVQKRHTPVDERPDVLCAYVRSIGETLDTYRAADPDSNDLKDVADFFLLRKKDNSLNSTLDFIKLVSAEEFTPNDRWDVSRFWTEEEFVKLGVKPSAIRQEDFIDDVIVQITELGKELKKSKTELVNLTKSKVLEVELNDSDLFYVRSGTRVTNTQVRLNPGTIPVYSCFKHKQTKKGDISEEFLREQKIKIENPTKTVITVAANGYVGTVFVRNEKCMFTDDLIVIEVKNANIDPEYLSTALKKSIAVGGYSYEAKLFKGRVEQLIAEIPIDEAGNFDLKLQKRIASAQRRFDQIRDKLTILGKWSDSARFS